MEKGTVKTFSKICGLGMISRLTDEDLQFYADSIVGGSRADVKQGDSVWFEVGNIKNLHIAINIRKCNEQSIEI